MTESYDCTKDVLQHRERVAFWLKWIIEVLEYRAKHHDESKLQPPEKQIFDEYTPKLKQFELGSPEYQAALKEMGEGLQHHYKHNPHHPEFHRSGIAGMPIWDVVEMIADWMAAASVRKSASNEHVDLDYLQKRFHIDPQLRRIIANTLWSADMDAINWRIPEEYMPINNFLDPHDPSLRWDDEQAGPFDKPSGGGEEDRLQNAAREWIAYYDKYGAREFNRRFGTKEVHGDEFIKFLREFLTVGEASNLSDAGN